MSRFNFARLSGLAAAFGGVLSVMINTLNFGLILSVGRPLAFFARGPILFSLLQLLEIAIAVFLAVGLTGLYALSGRRRSWLGISGLFLAYLSVLASLSFMVFAVFYVAYQLLTRDDGLIGNPWIVFPEQAFNVAGALLLGGSILLLGVAAFGARILGRWRILPLVLGFLIVVLPLLRLVLPFLPTIGVPWGLLFFGPLSILRGLCWILLGGVLWAYASREEARVVAQGVPAS